MQRMLPRPPRSTVGYLWYALGLLAFLALAGLACFRAGRTQSSAQALLATRGVLPPPTRTTAVLPPDPTVPPSTADLPAKSYPLSPIQELVWITETVDSTGDTGSYASLALDAQDRPHISYCQHPADRGYCIVLKYAYHDGTSWHTEVAVVDGNEFGTGTALAVDAAGRPHISYQWVVQPAYTKEYELRYVYLDGTTWVTTTIDNGWLAGDGGSSIALDSAGRPHISYYNGEQGLRYASYTDSSWRYETVESGLYNGYCSSLVLDADDRPHLSFISGAPGTILRYAYRSGFAWAVETVDYPGEFGCPTSLALGRDNHPYIAYTLGAPMVGCWQKYAASDGQGWSLGTIGAHAGEGSLALDTAGLPHIAYGGSPDYGGGLFYTSYDGTAWFTETVDSTAYEIAYISLALDAAGRVHIAYYNHNTRDLLYAFQCASPGNLAIAGPARLPLGATGLYSATAGSASPPLAFAWNKGGTGPTMAYSWTVTGTYPVAVTATNPCGQAAAALTVTTFCQPVEGITLTGPTVLLVGQEGLFSAASQPITASRPLTITWDAGRTGETVAYSWTLTGTYTLNVTMTNGCGMVHTATWPVRVLAEWPYALYLPLVRRE